MIKGRYRALACSAVLIGLLSGCGAASLATGAAKYLKDFDPADYVSLGEYTGLTVDVEEPEEDASAEEKYVANRLAVLAGEEVTDRAAMAGDTANIDFAGRYADSDEYFDGGTSQGYDLVLGSGTFIPGFEEGVIGMFTGEEKDIPLTFPENYGSAELAGVDVVFEVKLNSITGPTDRGVSALGLDGISTVETYAEYLKDQYADSIAREYRQSVESALRDKIESGSIFKTPPAGFIQRMKDSYREQIEILADAYSSAYGQTVTVSDLLSYAMSGENYSGDEDDYIESAAAGNANTYIMIGAIADEQGITVSDEELRERLEENLSSSGFSTLEEYERNADQEEIREQILYDKVMDYLYDNNSVQ